MKIALTSLVFLVSSAVFAKPLTSMGLIEKASYQIGGQVSQKKIDASFLTDILTVKVVQDAAGTQIQMTSPSLDPLTVNLFAVNFDAQGVLMGTTASFHSVGVGSPFLKPTTAATYLDKIAEAFVDHLAESPDYLEVAQKVSSVQLVPNEQGLLVSVNLNDGRIYTMQMDTKAKVISRGF